jgi:DNA-binding MarR family transcriptional regulator
MTRKPATDRKSTTRQSDYERLAQFRYVLRRFLVFSQTAAKIAGLTPQQHQALLAIKGFGGKKGIGTGALAERLCLRHHSAVGLIDRLAANGLAVRRPTARDRRQVLVCLTPKAEAVLDELSAAHHRELERMAPLLRPLLRDFES